MKLSSWKSKDLDGTGSRNRKYIRKSTSISASVSDIETGKTLMATILDVNPEGCRIECDGLALLGDYISVTPDGFKSSIKGEFAWRRRNTAGIKFNIKKPRENNLWIKIIESIRHNMSQQHPRYYELWFNYVTKSDSELTKTIDAAIKKYGRVPDNLLDEIYDVHLSPTRAIKKIAEVNSHLTGEFNNLEKALNDASASTVDFEKSLELATKELGNSSNSEQVRAVVGRIIKVTQEMERKSQGLEEKLLNSRNEISSMNDTLEAIKLESLTDALTGIANRKHFNQILEASIADATQTGTPLALLLGDIDHFKAFNDNYGHLIGDKVLKLVAHVISSNVEKSDLAARYGGEEFAVILQNADLKSAVIAGNQIREAIAAKELSKKSDKGSLGSISMSLGAAVYRPDEDIDAFIGRADAALYAAKRGGRNLVRSENEIESQNTDKVA